MGAFCIPLLGISGAELYFLGSVLPVALVLFLTLDWYESLHTMCFDLSTVLQISVILI